MLKNHRATRLAAIISVFFVIAISASAFVSPWSGFSLSALSQAAGVESASEPASMLTPGVCDTAGPIEVEATAGTMGPTAYATLKLAFDAINAGTHQGTITIDVCGDTTEAAVAAAPSMILNASGVGAALYTSIVMSPAGGAARTISGTSTAGFPMIDFVGADQVIINGLNTGGNSLTISNTTVSATSGTGTIRYTTDATSNTITNASILGSATMAVGTNGGNISFTSSSVTTGQDNNTVSNCDLGPAGANLPSKVLHFSGSSNTDPGTANSGIVINNNNIFDYFSATVASAGIDLNSGTVGTTISNNRFYQTAARTQTTAAQHSAIRISNTSGNAYQITGNTIGFAAANGTGTYTFVGIGASSTFVPINLSVGTTTATSVQGNTIAGIAMSGAVSGTSSSASFRGIYVGSGLTTVGDVNGNTIGSQSVTGSITFTSSSASAADVIGMFNFGSSNWTTNNNTVGGITVSNSSTGAANLYGIRCFTSSTVTWTVMNNTVGGTVANSMNSTSTATGTIVQGILNSSPIGTFTGNTIRNMTAAGGTGTTTAASVAGIVITATSNQTIGQNTIFNLSNTNATAASVVTGIQFTGGTGNIVERNLIHSLTTATNSATAELNGIRVAGGTTIYRNNMIAIGAGVANAIGGAATNSSTAGVNGINEALGTDSFFHNSVYIGGAPTAGTGASYAFNGTQTTNTRSFRDNIFFNARTNAGVAAGSNYAVKINGTTPNPTGLTINNNVYNANGAGAVFGFFNGANVANLAAWQAAVGQDANSIEANPLFVSVTDLHLQAGSPAIDVAANLGVTNDFDGKSRPGANSLFDIGADERDGIAPVTNDMQATAFIDPTNGGTKLVSSTFSPQASFTNNGTAAQTNVTVRYRICADVGCTTVIYNQTAVIASIASLATVNVTFSSTSIGTAGAYTIKATSELGTDTVPANNEITGTLNIQAPLAGTYTVGTGGDYPSLTNNGGIFEAINSLGASGTITIEILNSLSGELGTHALNEIAGGFSTTLYPCSNPVTITGSNTGALIRLNGADNVTINGDSNACSPPAVVGGTPASRHLTIQNTNTGTSAVVISVASNGTNGAQNNTIQNVRVLGQDPLTSLIGISLGAASPGTIATGPNNNNRVENCFVGRTIFGIYSAGRVSPDQNTGTVITQNETSAVVGDRVRRVGIVVFNENGVQITENSINGISTNESADGIGIGVGTQGIDTTNTTSGGVIDALVDRNKINGVASLSTTGFSAAGITVAGGTGGANTVRNNMITGVTAPSTSPDIVAGIYVVGAAGSSTRLYHNSIANTGDRGAVASQMPSYGVAITGTDPSVELKNNIFYTTQTSGGGVNAVSYAIGMGTTTFVNLDSNYNDFWSAGANDGGFRTGSLASAAGTSHVDLTAWQTAVSDDANSQEADPVFVNPANDLHLAFDGPAGNPDSPLIGDGLTGFAAVDYDNDPRPATAPEIGADELVQSTGGSFPAGIFYNAISAPGDQMAGSVTITNSITLNGILNTGNFNTLTMGCNATFANAGGGNYVVGTVNKEYCGTGAFTYPVGTTPDNTLAGGKGEENGIPNPPEYTPVSVNVTGGTFPSFLSVRVFDGTLIGFDPANSLSRNWELNELGDITADLSFTYLDGAITDVNGTEANYIAYRRNANGTTDPMCLGPCVDTVNNILGPVTGVTQFSRWSGAALAPTAAGVNVSGRVLVPGGGGLRNATVTLTDARGVTQTSRSTTFGYYKFEDVRVGETYVLDVNSKRYVFTPRTVQVLDEVTGLDITAEGER